MLPPVPTGATPSLRAREHSGPYEPQRISKTLCAKTLGARSLYPAPHLGPPHCLPHNHHQGPATLLVANPNPRSDPKVPFPRGLVPQSHGLWNTEPQGQTHPATRLPSVPIGVPPIIQGRKQAGPSEPPATFKGPPRQNLWSHAPPPVCSTLGPPLHSRHRPGSGLMAS